MSIVLGIYKSREDAYSGTGVIKEDNLDLIGNEFISTLDESILESGGTNIRKQLYAWIKTQSNYVDATDVLEES